MARGSSINTKTNTKIYSETHWRNKLQTTVAHISDDEKNK